jgi:hypothetical protein
MTLQLDMIIEPDAAAAPSRMPRDANPDEMLTGNDSLARRVLARAPRQSFDRPTKYRGPPSACVVTQVGKIGADKSPHLKASAEVFCWERSSFN